MPLIEVTLAKLSFAHKGPDEPSGYFGFESVIAETIEEPSVSESSSDLPITGDFSEEYSVHDEDEMSEVSEHREVEENVGNPTVNRDPVEEQLVQFNVNSDLVKQLGAILNPAMPPEVFLMYLVSLEFISFGLLVPCFLHCSGKLPGILMSASTICWLTARFLRTQVQSRIRSGMFV